MSLITIRVTKAEANQLLAYVEERDYDGWYYGPKDQFERRHASLLEILRKVLGITDTSSGDPA